MMADLDERIQAREPPSVSLFNKQNLTDGKHKRTSIMKVAQRIDLGRLKNDEQSDDQSESIESKKSREEFKVD